MKKSFSLPGLLGLPHWPSQSRRLRFPPFRCLSTRCSSSGRLVDYSLYLVTDDKFLADKQNVCRKLIGKVREGVLGGVGLVQLRLKKADDRYFYNTAVRMKNLLGKYKVPLIINNRIDICLGVDADGVHVGRTDLPIKVARDILGGEKIIGATINFSNDEDIQMALNNDVDYIAHEHTLYESTTKEIAASHHEGMKQQIHMLLCRIKHLQERGKIYKPSLDSKAPPIILIGGINNMNIEETMTHFCHSCAGVAVVLRFVIDKHKKGYNDAFVNLCVSCLRHVFWTNLESDMKGAHTSWVGGPPMETSQSEAKGGNFRLVTNMDVKKNVHHFFENNLDLKIVQLNQPVVCSSAGGSKIFLFCSRRTGVAGEARAREATDTTDATDATDTADATGATDAADAGEGRYLHGEGKRTPISHDPCVSKWIQQNKKIANGVFILIGEDFLALFRKFLAPEFFRMNNFVVITMREQSGWETVRCDVRGASIQFSNNLINVALKNIHVNSEAVNRFAILLAYFLMVQEKMKQGWPQFLTQIVGEGEATADAGEEGKLLKLAAAVNMSFEVLSNEHTELGLAAFSS
ncbi:thiamin-phosphate pyrophosphorylase [Plasmodium cynomolgi strain B]|uniref:Thiamin-phosphate pyrophosphorylase n=1 Tax=Plasmodium cynomolgi (strain B) TaxID=1120755 RepID=K6UDY5_PLACD|nr:thiamin-phosphate pyrophosphorylase [Plasmodium cynomolgi strain B]GAB67411.1 thiamin-phosphate pyrophosphorylase [Plasmodium cynomolgi strain B]